ncbi:CoA transferase [Pseudoduganella sp. UC29_106]|uniref:CoA transferase n=1 Tax=Pseudoduganella sp. UC29_106 TaxID=3374553 RepID=UPI0037579E90
MQDKTSPLTAPLRAILAQRETGDAPFNINAHLNAVLEGIGIRPDSTGGSITFTGADPIVPSVFRLGAAAGTAIMVKSAAMASLWAMRTGEGQDISLDIRKAPRRLCPFFERRWEKLNGYPIRNNADPDNPFMRAFFEAKDGRWVMPFNLYPRMRSQTIRMLGCSDDPAAIAAAIAKWDAYELELAGAEQKVVMPVVRSLEEFMEESQYRDHLSHLPLIQIEKIGESEPEPFSANATQPLDGIKALGLARVIAGSAIGRAMALHGADVLNIWRPTDHEIDTMYATANVGVRSALLDIGEAEGHARMTSLLRDADVFYANRRLGFLDRHGFSAEEAAAIRPGIVHVSISLHGETGPWANRAGFDQTAGAVTGVMSLEGRPDAPQLPPVMVVNDNIVGWLCTAGAVAALMRRAKEGGSYRVHVSLTRVSLWLYSMGIFDKEYAHGIAGSGGDHLQLEPELFSADTPAGHYQGVTDQVVMSRTPGAYRTVFVPRGSCRPEWLHST